MIGAQGRYFLLDELMGGVARLTGAPVPWLFLAAQGLTLATLFGGAWWLGRAVLTSPWALAGWIAALTLRHRIAKTGVNTLEGYFHPRVLVCGLGLMSVGAGAARPAVVGARPGAGERLRSTRPRPRASSSSWPWRSS